MSSENKKIRVQIESISYSILSTIILKIEYNLILFLLCPECVCFSEFIFMQNDE